MASIAVPDIDRAIEWYGDVFGFATTMRMEVPGIPARGAFMQGPGVMLELWCKHGVKPVPDERRVPDADLGTAGTKHMGFTVGNLQSKLPELLRRGVDIAAVQRTPAEPMRPDADPCAPGKPPVFSIFLRDPFGTLIEVLERSAAP
jgi:catechol 2,3-dioxygenase-like lactoylglutathione lyase family enzyme